MRNLLAGLGASASVAFVVLASPACGSDGGSTFIDPNAAESGLEDGSFNPNNKPDGGDPFANDPPPKYCVIDGGPAQVTVTGTPECPSDKNKPGCGCTTAGETAACWTGLRANRHNGVCKDGMTTCNQVDENNKAWGPCEGQVLPAAGQTKGAQACKCFSIGQWKLPNLSPCFREYCGETPNPDGSCVTSIGYYAMSTFDDGTGAKCTPQGNSPPPTLPPGPWTTDTLRTDCAGRFTLCYALKAGDFASPKATDCTLTKQCVTGDYVKENVEQPFPSIPAWIALGAADQTCARQWNATGGYGEMTVVGESVLCDKVDDGAGNAFVFNRIQYCPSKCQKEPAKSTDPACINCKQDGSGEFK